MSTPLLSPLPGPLPSPFAAADALLADAQFAHLANAHLQWLGDGDAPEGAPVLVIFRQNDQTLNLGAAGMAAVEVTAVLHRRDLPAADVRERRVRVAGSEWTVFDQKPKGLHRVCLCLNDQEPSDEHP